LSKVFVRRLWTGMILPAADRRRRAHLYVACATVGLVFHAGWSFAAGAAGDFRLDVARWWSLVIFVGFAALLGLGLVVQRRRVLSLAADVVGTMLGLLTLITWVHATGQRSTCLAALPALVVMAHRITGGLGFGLLALGTSIVGHWAAFVLELRGLLGLALLDGGGENALDRGSDARWILRIAVTDATALFIGGFTRPRRGRHHPVRSESRRIERSVSRIGWELLTPVSSVLIGPYRLGPRIGKGGMSEVYRGQRLTDGIPVAIKILRRDLASTPEALLRFRREAEAASRLTCARFVQVLDVIATDEDLHCIIMEYLEGEDLAAHLRRRGVLPLEEIAAIATQLAEALDAAATHGIVHRDLKPSNVFLVALGDGRLDVRLLDLGICHMRNCTLARRLTRSGVLLGSPGYLAPEQVAKGLGELGPHTDVFALAAIVYRALTGKSAFPARRSLDAAHQALNHHPVPLLRLRPELPEALSTVLATALAKNPKDRYASAGEFARDLCAAARSDLSLDARACAAPPPAFSNRGDSTLTIEVERRRPTQ
jgi:serine/threonine protein kinase